MAGPTRIDQTPIRLETKVADARQTPKTDFGSKVAMGAQSLANTVAVAAPLVPGGAVLSAAVSGVQSLGGAPSASWGVGGGGNAPGSTSTPSVPGTGSSTGTGAASSASGTIPGVGSADTSNPSSFLNVMAASNTQFLMLQQQMQLENQKFTTLSNVIRVRHDTSKNAIGNIR